MTSKTNKTLLYIAIWKFIKGIFLLLFGLASLYVIQIDLLDDLIEFVQQELLQGHFKIVQWLLSKVIVFLTGNNLETTGILALCYSAVLIAEGIGVYLNKKWAEWLIVISTASLIPFELYHLFNKPSLIKFVVLAANGAIAIYLYRMLRKKHE